MTLEETGWKRQRKTVAFARSTPLYGTGTKHMQDMDAISAEEIGGCDRAKGIVEQVF